MEIYEIKNFIGVAKHDEFKGTYIWGVDKQGGNQMIAEVRGWGAIQNMFKNKDGSINFEDAEQFQDELGKFITEAINEKLNKQEYKDKVIQSLIDTYNSDILKLDEDFKDSCSVLTLEEISTLKRVVTDLKSKLNKQD
jgi:polyhydroxyalkanoate synthesis regulator phasin